MKKKLFATLGALCLGVILCVSTVFAVNWWYSIQNNATSTITFGKKITLTTSGNGGAAAGVYQNSVITFDAFTVKAPKWDAQTITGDGSHTNDTLPTFNLKLAIVDGEDAPVTAASFLSSISIKVGDAEATVMEAAAFDTAAGVILTDIQADAAFDVVISITIADKLDPDLAGDDENDGATFTFTAEIVADGVEETDTNLDTPVEP